jgi:transcription termination factor Rho
VSGIDLLSGEAERTASGDKDENAHRGRRRRTVSRPAGNRRPTRGHGRDEVGGGNEPEVREGDVLLPVAGILDVLENYAFVRTTGYLAGPNDVYVSLSLVRKYGLRRGDALAGVVRQPRDGEAQRQKFNPLVRVDSINGLEPEAARDRPEFHKLTPLYPNERLRLETEPHLLTTRVIDLVMPVGKGQRSLIVSPPKAGKTSVLQAIANGITTNHPECYLMVVLVDERPEEVTDMQRSVKGEVIASTFDRPPADHTTVAELSIERAKRLVEMGHDVVVLLDSITRLGRAYNLAAPTSGRILSGGVDSTALYPPKRFLGAARNIEGGGSLTIFATALVETGSTMDTVIFEEFKGTGNAELKLDRKIADKRVFPAVDIDPSSTRKEELLLSPDELAVVHKLRRVLHSLDSQQAIERLLTQLRKSRTNIECLMQFAKLTSNETGH